MTEIYLIAEPFIRARWPHQYGLAQPRGESLAGGIPTFHGCLILWYLDLDWEEFFAASHGRLDSYVLEELKELVAKGSYMAAGSIIHRIDRSKLREVLLSSTSLVRGIEFELPVVIPIPLKVDVEDAELELACLGESLLEARRLASKVVEGSTMFLDAEFRKWLVPMASPLDVYEVYEEAPLDLEEGIRQVVNELLAVVSEEMARPAYVLILRGEVPGDVSLSDFEAMLSWEVSNLTRLLEPACIFTTLSS